VDADYSRSNTSLEGVWHQAVKTNWIWINTLVFTLTYNLMWDIGQTWKLQYYSSHGIIYENGYLFFMAVGMALASTAFVVPLAYWTSKNKIPLMLKFDDAGIAMQLKNGLVVEAGWNLVKYVKNPRWTKLTSIKIRGMVYPFSSQFPPEVHAALVAKLARIRKRHPEPSAPTLEDIVDRSLAARNRM